MKIIKIIILIQLFFSCQGSIGAGTLGGWYTTVFPITEQQLDMAIDSFYIKYPQYKTPNRLKYAADYWKRGGYDFLKSDFFYFENKVQEMYYVTYIDPGYGVKNPEYARLAIRAVYIQDNGWKINEDFKEEEKLRIAKRFKNEIISKLETITQTKSHPE